ncbi:hypothetical protein SELMODRAFT_427547 [Selaginella moellendorffii]|uniref:Uncharacterized protein n=1 Tax=Selaginella moellendorffii TaxID=88036 RepID=D8SZY6_SELML|nr:hypothetical protein SELMODRAFT_427547 [Selaginella moellendorffii]
MPSSFKLIVVPNQKGNKQEKNCYACTARDDETAHFRVELGSVNEAFFPSGSSIIGPENLSFFLGALLDPPPPASVEIEKALEVVAVAAVAELRGYGGRMPSATWDSGTTWPFLTLKEPCLLDWSSSSRSMTGRWSASSSAECKPRECSSEDNLKDHRAGSGISALLRGRP